MNVSAWAVLFNKLIAALLTVAASYMTHSQGSDRAHSEALGFYNDFLKEVSKKPGRFSQ